MSNTARPKSAGDKLSADEVNKDLPILLNAGETINGATLPVAGCILSDADGASTKRISQETNDNHSSQIWGQTFTTDATMNRIDSVMLRIDATATATINIYAVDGSGFPTGGSLGSTSVVVNGSGQDTFSFSTAVIVSPSTKYAVCLTASLNTCFATGDTYANGDAIYYDAGEWKNYSINAIDLEFNVYGHVFTASDGKAYACDGNDTLKLSFLGFLVSNSTNGNPIQLQNHGVVSGFTGLTIDSKYYVQDDGTIGLVPGTFNILVGIAISATQILIEKKSSFGDWLSKSVNTSYLADTDGFCVGYGTDNDDTSSIQTDSSNPPTTIRARNIGGANGIYPGATCPVKKGDYYKFNCTTGVVFFLPLS